MQFLFIKKKMKYKEFRIRINCLCVYIIETSSEWSLTSDRSLRVVQADNLKSTKLIRIHFQWVWNKKSIFEMDPKTYKARYICTACNYSIAVETSTPRPPLKFCQNCSIILRPEIVIELLMIISLMNFEKTSFLSISGRSFR